MSSYRPVTLPYRRVKHANFEPEDDEEPYPGEEQHRPQHGLAIAAFLTSTPPATLSIGVDKRLSAGLQVHSTPT